MILEINTRMNHIFMHRLHKASSRIEYVTADEDKQPVPGNVRNPD